MGYSSKRWRREPGRFLPEDRPVAGQGGRRRPESAHGSRSAPPSPDIRCPPALLSRQHGRGKRHRARETQGAAGPKGEELPIISRTTLSTTPVLPRPPGLCRGVLRPDDRRPDGCLCPHVPGPASLLVMLAKGNRTAVGERSLQEIRRLLPGLDRRPAAARLAKECITRMEVLEYPGAGHGSDLLDHCKGLSRLHHRRTTRETISSKPS